MRYIPFLIILLLFRFGANAQIQEKVYRNLVMEGGGIKGIAYGGALKELEQRGVMQNIIRVAGTSAGAIQASLVAVGYSAEEISDIIANTPIESFNDDGIISRGSKRLIKKYGWFQGDEFLKEIENRIFLRTGNINLTFADLHQLAKTYPFRDLYVTGANLSSQQVEVFSHETYPNMRVADAVRISMSIPLYYRALWLSPEGKVVDEPTPSDKCSLFVDGGLLMNYPVEVFDSTKYLADNGGGNTSIFNEETIGFRLERCEQIDHEIDQRSGIAPFEINDFGSYMSALSSVIMRNIHPPHARDSERTVYINDLGMSARVRKVPEEEKKLMMLSGQHGVSEFFQRFP
ncbi:MAG: patatin-like phospholipase family protein [Spirosomaceae bacterium]|nr:patatin-like phospholipase family protein [Spirosomataceae bacterium]